MDVIESVKKEGLRRRYSIRTIETYLVCVRNFLNFCHKDPIKFTKKDVKDYLDILSEKNKSGSTINVNLQALKFMMEYVLNKRKYFYNIKYSKVARSLPLVLNKDEVIKLINSIENDKHKLMIKLLYSAGLRVSELLNLKICDLDIANNFGYVRKGKGNKDRMFIIADSLKQEISDCIINDKLNQDNYLFISYMGRMSSRTVQEIIKKAVHKIKLGKKVHPHTLRHSFSTHLIENGYSVSEVQSLLGHKSPETTMIYVHMVSPKFIAVRSPLDDLQLQDSFKKICCEDENFEERKSIMEENNNLSI